jgi:hypothetical protein
MTSGSRAEITNGSYNQENAPAQYDMSHLEEGHPMIFSMDKYEVSTWVHVSDQEEEESIDKTSIPQVDTRPTRATRKPLQS